MALYRKYDYRNDETIDKIAAEFHLKPKTVLKIISVGFRNINIPSFKKLVDDESEVRDEEYTAAPLFKLLTMLLHAMQKCGSVEGY